MVAYTGIQGQNILIVSSDPANPVEGQIWYNSTSNLLKGYAFAPAAWATGGSLNNALEDMAGNVGTQTAALAVAGYFAPSSPGGASNLTEEYDGTSWTSGGNQPNSYFRRTSTGSQTAALGWGGYNPTGPTVPTRYNSGSNEYDGTSWTTGGGFPVGIQFAGGAGSQTAALSVAGNSAATSFQSLVAKYDGTSWTTSTSVPQGLRDPVTIGTQTATLNVGGTVEPGVDNFGTDAVNTFNGTTWTSSPVYPTPLWAGYGMGTQTDALVAGGARNPSPTSPGTRTTNVNLWNGTSWTSQTAIPTAKSSGNSAGTAASGLMAGGGGSPIPITLEWTGAGAVTRTITTS
jgi:hypothetical protein